MARRGASLVTNFSAGEIDPKARGRVDLSIYPQAASNFRNMQPYAIGGARFRPGLRYLNTLPGDGRLLEFIFDDDERYVIFLGENSILFYNENGSLVQSLASPWTLAQIREITYVQLYDKVFVCHEAVPIQEITRTSLSSFEIREMEFESYSTGFSKKPFWRYTDIKYGLAASGLSGTVALGCYTANGSQPVTNFWNATHIGRRFRLFDSDVNKVSEFEVVGPVVHGSQDIQAVVIGTPTVAGVIPFGSGDWTTDWTQEAFNSDRGYPAAVGIYGKRLWFGGGRDAPEGVWASRIDAFFDYDIGPNDDDGLRVGLVGDRVQQIRHIVAPKRIGFLTRDTEWIDDPSLSQPMITPATFDPKPQSKYGAKKGVKPVFYDGSVLFPQKNGRDIRELRWEELEQTYKAESVSLLANHLIINPIDACVQYGTTQRPEQFAYFVNADGSIAVFHAVKDQKIAGWGLWHCGARYENDGGIRMDNDILKMDTTTSFTMDVAGATGSFRSIASLDERLYAVVNRLGVYTLEEFDPALNVDNAITVRRATSGKIFEGLSHLEGLRVWVIWRGYSLGSAVVTDGVVDLSAAAIPSVTDVDVGLFYGSRLKLMPADFAQAVTGNVQQGQVRRIVSATITPDELGRVLVNGWPLLLQTATVAGASLSEPTSDPTEFVIFGSSREPAVEIYNDQPTTGSILAVHAKVVA